MGDKKPRSEQAQATRDLIAVAKLQLSINRWIVGVLALIVGAIALIEFVLKASR